MVQKEEQAAGPVEELSSFQASFSTLKNANDILWVAQF